MRKKLFRSSPMSSPSKERYGDRFIPVRSGNNWETNFSSIPVSAHFVSIYLLFNEKKLYSTKTADSVRYIDVHTKSYF